MATLESSATEDCAPVGSSGTGSEAVHSGAASLFRLVSSFRHSRDTLQAIDYRIAGVFASRQTIGKAGRPYFETLVSLSVATFGLVK